MKKLALVLVLAVSMTACKTNKQYKAGVDAATTSGYNSGYSAGQSDAQANATKASNFMLQLKAENPSAAISVVKFAKDNANMVVFNYGGAFYAVDISAYTVGTGVYAYISGHTIYGYLTDNGNGTFSCNAGTCMNLAGGTSSTMVFEKTTAGSKDMDKAAAFVEAYQVETMAASLAAQFGLSDERSLKVAKLAASWDKLSKTRALTNADADAFSQELVGVSISDMENAEKAMIGGSMAEMNAVVSKAAEVNGTTSENMNAIMQKLFF